VKYSTQNSHIDYLKNQIAVLPGNPGIYQFLDDDGKIIYIGKALNLKKRVTSYFCKTA
jgi:excinuclease ABC subunit C